LTFFIFSRVLSLSGGFNINKIREWDGSVRASNGEYLEVIGAMY